MEKWKKVLLIITSFLLISGYVPVNAQIDTWTVQYKLEIHNQQPNKTFGANGEDEAKMNIVIINKTTNILEIAQSDVVVFLRSENGILKTRKITILKGNAQSDDISLTSTEPGIAIVIAEAVGFSEPATTSIKFIQQPNPSELSLTAQPDENIMANGIDSTLLTVKLLNPDGNLFVPQTDVNIDISTNKGDRLPPIQIPKNKRYVQAPFNTTKAGVVGIEASSPDFRLENNVNVIFVSPLTILTTLLALLGGFLGGIVKYYEENKKKISFSPKYQSDGTWSLGLLGFAAFHALFGFIVYLGATFDMPFTNLFNLPYYNWEGSFMIGVTGGLFGSIIIYLWGRLYKAGEKND